MFKNLVTCFFFLNVYMCNTYNNNNNNTRCPSLFSSLVRFKPLKMGEGVTRNVGHTKVRNTKFSRSPHHQQQFTNYGNIHAKKQ